MERDLWCRSISGSQTSSNFRPGVRLQALDLEKSWNSVLFYPKKELRARNARLAPLHHRRNFRRIFLDCEKSSFRALVLFNEGEKKKLQVSSICTLWPLWFHQDFFVSSLMQPVCPEIPQFCSF